jgi:protein AATF/BFR2
LNPKLKYVLTVLLQEPIKTKFCNHDEEIEQAYEDLLTSSKQTLASMTELQEVQFLLHFFIAMFFLNIIEGFLTVLNI